ncbi:hypothetical protein [Winogradskyella sp. UBA3174]|uniref:hypothetical protein n=1 Tax=Winogradskyella sp. UBA3174 TaxID=1947785 RepID=UPI0025ED8A52|nr:hypothetical protein [Winogradskyella sp. UBA3174]
MYTRGIFPVAGFIKWTRRHIFLFLILAIIPVVLFDIRQLIDDTRIPKPYEWKNDIVM